MLGTIYIRWYRCTVRHFLQRRIGTRSAGKSALRPIPLLTLWISEGFTQAQSLIGWHSVAFRYHIVVSVIVIIVIIVVITVTIIVIDNIIIIMVIIIMITIIMFIIATVSFHNFKSQKFKLSVSNPKSKYVA